MTVRKLEVQEHGKTRALWENVFPEDSKRFLDYYYFIKAKDNEIYVIEEDGAVRSMLQLNPYTVQAGAECFRLHYIVGVATEKEYRSRGYMGKLLCRALHAMYERREPFTFLMPAAEAIYTPYDFRFIYDQYQGKVSGCADDMKTEMTDASLGDAADMSAFFEKYFAGQWDVYAVRDEVYYQTMIFEQQSEEGGVMLLRSEGNIVGMFAWADEDGMEIREPLYLPEYKDEFLKAVYRLRGSGPAVPVYAAESSVLEDMVRKPVIMARIVYLPALLSSLHVKQGEVLHCSFAVLDPILPQNNRIWRIWNEPGDEKIQVRETEDSDGVLTIRALTSLLFGYKDVSDIAKEEYVVISDELTDQFRKIRPLSGVFLNEII